MAFRRTIFITDIKGHELHFAHCRDPITGSFATIGSAASLCDANTRVVFSCAAGEKVVSLCAKGNLKTADGRLIYRFGRDADHIELEHGATSNPAKSSYTFNSESWAKGQSSTIAFERGQYKYIVNHAAGVYGVDGGPNTASVRVLRGQKQVASISCHEASAVDHFYEELTEVGLPSSNAL